MLESDTRLVHSLSAVIGWLELGNPKEARAELESLDPKYRDDFDVLDINWLLYARDCNWAEALRVAERLIDLHPDDPAGWLHRAFSVRRVPEGGLQRAAELLRPAFEKFPKEPTIPFNLACYACQLGNLEQSRQWLREAIQRQPDGEIKKMALADHDLEPLWPEIKKW